MKEIILGAIPGSVFVYRYASRFELTKIIGLFLMELAPYLLVCYFQDISKIYALIGFITIYSIYEFGYIDNDLFAVNNESTGKTVRYQFKKFKIKYFLITRIFTTMIFLYILFDYINSYEILILLILLLLIFAIHNRIVNIRYRVITFLVLNNIKIIIRLLIISSASFIYFLSFMPHIFTKMLHYLFTKELALVNEDNFNKIKISIYIGFLFSIIFIDFKLAIVMSPLLLNHNKKYILNFFIKRHH